MWYDEESPSEAGCVNVCEQNGKAALAASTCKNALPSVSNAVSTPLANQFVDLPHNFYWAIPGKLIGMGCPSKRKHIENLVEHHKVSVVVNLRECRTADQLFDGSAVRNVHFPIKSFGVPTIGQVQQFIRVVDEVLEPDPAKGKGEDANEPAEAGHADRSENNERKDYKKGLPIPHTDEGRCIDCDLFGANAKSRTRRAKRNRHGMVKEFLCKKEECRVDASEGIRSKRRKKKEKKKVQELLSSEEVITPRTVAVNCRWGKGRTGTMICCYLVHREGITAHEAICRIRVLSPCSIETKGQEEFVEEFYRLKLVAEGREDAYVRSLPYPYAPQQHNHRTFPGPAVSVANATYGRHEPTAKAYAMRVASANNNKICFNNSLLLAKMYK